MSIKRDAIMEALFDLLRTAPDGSVNTFVEAVKEYRTSFPRSVNQAPPFMRDFFATVDEYEQYCDTRLSDRNPKSPNYRPIFPRGAK